MPILGCSQLLAFDYPPRGPTWLGTAPALEVVAAVPANDHPSWFLWSPPNLSRCGVTIFCSSVHRTAPGCFILCSGSLDLCVGMAVQQTWVGSWDAHALLPHELLPSGSCSLGIAGPEYCAGMPAEPLHTKARKAEPRVPGFPAAREPWEFRMLLGFSLFTGPGPYNLLCKPV